MEKKILVRGYYNYNFGDDLFSQIILEKYPDTSFLFVAPKPYRNVWRGVENATCIGTPMNLLKKIVARLGKMLSISLYRKLYLYYYNRFYYKLSQEIDAYIVLGGSMYKEDANAEMECMLNKVIRQSLQNVPCFVIGANFGPFQTPQFFEFYKNHFSFYSDICFRDSYSARMFESLPNVRKESDIVFQYKLPSVERDSNTVGIVVVDLAQHPGLGRYAESYNAFIDSLICKYSAKGYSLTLIAFQQNEEAYLDSIICQYSDKKIKKIIYKGVINDFIESYLRLDTVFATRFHAMIISLKSGQKLCPIIYNQKMDNVLDDIKYKGKRVRLDNLQISETDIDAIDNMPPIDVSALVSSSSLQFCGLDKVIYNKAI